MFKIFSDGCREVVYMCLLWLLCTYFDLFCVLFRGGANRRPFCEIVKFLVSDKSSCVGFNLCYYCKYSLSPVWCLMYFDAFSSLPYDLNFKINSDGKVQHTDPYYIWTKTVVYVINV